MRYHLVSLPHTDLTDDYSWCAYTMKVLKFARMMAKRGHEVITYAGPTDPGVGEHVDCTDGNLPPNGEIPIFDYAMDPFASFNALAKFEMKGRAVPGDFICLIGGMAQRRIAAAFPDNQVVEYGIGYGGVIPSTHWVFESYAWMHTVYGARAIDPHAADGRFFDTVIPNYFEVDQFPAGDGNGGYLLYMGRLIERKGIQIALDLAEKTDLPLKVAGTGDVELPDWVDYQGVVGPEQRAELMGGAIALLAPTLYVEPFGGVVIEANLCGTPVLTTDWGAFTETVRDGRNGFRCRSMADFQGALDLLQRLDRQAIREEARLAYSTDTIAVRYELYFERLETLWRGGFYEPLVLEPS